jgi:hypothetical protein
MEKGIFDELLKKYQSTPKTNFENSIYNQLVIISTLWDYYEQKVNEIIEINNRD